MRQRNLDLKSKWTALEPICGWQHFWISGRLYRDGVLIIELMAACDRAVRFEVSADDLRSAGRFVAGWSDLRQPLG